MPSALIYSPYLDTIGGGEVYVGRIASALEANNFQVTFAWNNPDIINRFSTYLSIHLNSKINPSLYQLFSKPGNLQKKFQLTRHFDLCFFVSDGSIPWLFSRTNLLHFQVPFSSLDTSIITRIKLLKINKLIFNSKFTQSVISTQFPQQPSQVLYPPINLQGSASSTKHNIILSVARFSTSLHNKRQDYLISTFKQLVDQDLKHWQLHLVGSSSPNNPLVSRLQTSAKNYPISFYINQNATQLQHHYDSAKIFWHATGIDIDEQVEPEHVEHFGISTVEALASGCIPIVANKGGLKEIIQHGKSGFLFSSQSELATFTTDLINHYTSVAPALIKSGQIQAQNFSLARFNAQFTKLIHETNR